MRLIIDISEYDYSTIINDERYMPLDISVAIKNGTPCDIDAIRAEIAEDMQNADNEAKKTQDDIDCGIAIGLKIALDTIDKYTKGAEE